MMRFVVAMAVLFLAGCGDGRTREQVVLACMRGDPDACRTHRLREQIRLDTSAILLGMRFSDLES